MNSTLKRTLLAICGLWLFACGTAPAQTNIRMEAEAMMLDTYVVLPGNGASNRAFITLQGAGYAGSAISQFPGDDDTYDIFVAYHDENDGNAQLTVSVDGKTVDSWTLDQHIPSTEFSWSGNRFLRQIAADRQVNNGDEIRIDGVRGKWDQAVVDYIEFVVTLPHTIRVEAEDMQFDTYRIEALDFASNDALINLKGPGLNGSATTAFPGRAGQYDVYVIYHDENDGIAQLTVSIAGISVDSWTMDLKSSEAQPKSGNRLTRQVATDLTVNNGDEIRIEGLQGNWDHANVDYIDFVEVLDTSFTFKFDLDSPEFSVCHQFVGCTLLVDGASLGCRAGLITSDWKFVPGVGPVALAAGMGVTDTSYSPNDQVEININRGDAYGGEALVFNFDPDFAVETITVSTCGGGEGPRIYADGNFIGDFECGNTANGFKIPLPLMNSVSELLITPAPNLSDDNDFYVSAIEGSVKPQNVIRLEAEDMLLDTYWIEALDFASNGALINLKGPGLHGSATAVFPGNSGQYDISVVYHDENDGVAQLSVSIAGVSVDSWWLGFRSTEAQPKPANRRVREIATGYTVNSGDEIRIDGLQGNWDHANVDHIRFVPAQ